MWTTTFLRNWKLGCFNVVCFFQIENKVNFWYYIEYPSISMLFRAVLLSILSRVLFSAFFTPHFSTAVKKHHLSIITKPIYHDKLLHRHLWLAAELKKSGQSLCSRENWAQFDVILRKKGEKTPSMVLLTKVTNCRNTW